MDDAENDDLMLEEGNEPDFSKLPGDDEDLPESTEEKSEETETDEESGEATQIAETTEEKPVSVRQHLKVKRQKKEALSLAEAERIRREELERENAELRAKVAQSAPVNLPPIPPRIDSPDIGYDEDAYQQALRKYQLDLADYNRKEAEALIDRRLSAGTQAATAEDVQKKLASAMDAHHERADKLGLKPATYIAYEDTVINTFGEAYFNDMVMRLSNSERVVAHLGANQASREKLANLLKTDPVDATLWLGEINAKFSGQTRKQSNAPAPETELRGGGGKKPVKFEDEYKRALASGNREKAVSIMRQAMRAGVNL